MVFSGPDWVPIGPGGGTRGTDNAVDQLPLGA